MLEMRSVGIDQLALKLLGVEISDKKVQMPAPIFNGATGMPTKSAPAMSEEKFKEAIIAQAKKDFENGKFGGHNNASYMVLKNSFVSVVSPDRKGTIAQMMRQIPALQRGKVSYLEIKDAKGNITSTYSSTNGWDAIGTKEEFRRESEFDAIYTEAWRALKAQAQQQVQPTSSSIDTFI